jgi:hypothetical protein
MNRSTNRILRALCVCAATVLACIAAATEDLLDLIVALGGPSNLAAYQRLDGPGERHLVIQSAEWLVESFQIRSSNTLYAKVVDLRPKAQGATISKVAVLRSGETLARSLMKKFSVSSGQHPLVWKVSEDGSQSVYTLAEQPKGFQCGEHSNHVTIGFDFRIGRIISARVQKGRKFELSSSTLPIGQLKSAASKVLPKGQFIYGSSLVLLPKDWFSQSIKDRNTRVAAYIVLERKGEVPVRTHIFNPKTGKLLLKVP